MDLSGAIGLQLSGQELVDRCRKLNFPNTPAKRGLCADQFQFWLPADLPFDEARSRALLNSFDWDKPWPNFLVAAEQAKSPWNDGYLREWWFVSEAAGEDLLGMKQRSIAAQKISFSAALLRVMQLEMDQCQNGETSFSDLLQAPDLSGSLWPALHFEVKSAHYHLLRLRSTFRYLGK
jgi:hypothetical protein